MAASATRRLGYRLKELGDFLDGVMPIGSMDRREAFALLKTLKDLHGILAKEEGARRIEAKLHPLDDPDTPEWQRQMWEQAGLKRGK